MTGDDLKLSRHAPGLRPDDGQPVVLMQFTGKGSKRRSSRSHERDCRAALRQHATALRHRARPRDQVVPADRLRRSTRAASRRQRRADHRHRQRCRRRRTSRSCSRPARCPCDFKTVERSDVSATLGKDSLHQALTAALVGLLAVALFLLILYRFLGLVAVIGLGDLRGAPLRGDPALQRDADAAGLRRHDPHDRRRGRRERRHLRAHQGGVARRANRCARRSRRATRRASTRSSTRTS